MADPANTDISLTSIRQMLPFFLNAVFCKARNAAGAAVPGILKVFIPASDTVVDSAPMPLSFRCKDLDFYIVRNPRDFNKTSSARGALR